MPSLLACPVTTTAVVSLEASYQQSTAVCVARNLHFTAGYSNWIFTQTLIKDKGDCRFLWLTQAPTLKRFQTSALATPHELKLSKYNRIIIIPTACLKHGIVSNLHKTRFQGVKSHFTLFNCCWLCTKIIVIKVKAMQKQPWRFLFQRPRIIKMLSIK